MSEITLVFVVALVEQGNKVTVIDINFDCLHERIEYNTVDDDDHFELADAVTSAKEFADEHNLPYRPFSARHSNHINDDGTTVSG